MVICLLHLKFAQFEGPYFFELSGKWEVPVTLKCGRARAGDFQVILPNFAAVYIGNPTLLLLESWKSQEVLATDDSSEINALQCPLASVHAWSLLHSIL